MDLKQYADGFYPVTAVFSVEKKPDGYGAIRIVTGNKRYIDIIEHPTYEIAPGMPMNGKIEFIPNSLYEKYIPRNLNFEELCYRAAVLKEPIHTYVRPNKSDVWFNVFIMPINHEDGDLCYCTYTTKLTDAAGIGLASSHSIHTSEDVLRTCIKLHGTNDFSITLQEVITDIRLLCDAEVCTIMLLESDAGIGHVLAKSVQENSTLFTATEVDNFFDLATSWLDTIGRNDCIIIKNEKDMEYIREVNHPWWQTMHDAGVESVVMFPLQYNEETIGFIWASNFDTANTMRIKETLELTTYFLSSHIANYLIMKRLKLVSYTDMMTGVQNRNALNHRLDGIAQKEAFHTVSFGIVVADLNGLKRMNDTQGHGSGDILLKKTALLLQELFAGNEIYRAGGDEFIIIAENCCKEAFEQKVHELRCNSDAAKNVSIAVGSCYVISGADIRDAMKRADERMYKDKKAYYALHPEFDGRRKNKHHTG